MIRTPLFIFSLSLVVATAVKGDTPYEGIDAIGLVTDHQHIPIGETFTVALMIDPADGFHTYWRNPGSIGVAPSIQWDLPEGVTAGPIIWPAPEIVDMAGVKAYGSKKASYLLTEITTPADFQRKGAKIRATCAWMVCSRSCHPGIGEFTLRHPVSPNGKLKSIFSSVRRSQAPEAPDGWHFSAIENEQDEIFLEFAIPDAAIDTDDPPYFFAYDMQVDSDKPQILEKVDGRAETWQLRLVRPDFAPKDAVSLAGELRNPAGWPGLEVDRVAITIPWHSTIDGDE